MARRFRSPLPPPTITSLSENCGTAEVDGSGFTGATQVQENGTSVGFTVVSDTDITFSTGVSGLVTVTTPSGTASGTLPSAPPAPAAAAPRPASDRTSFNE